MKIPAFLRIWGRPSGTPFSFLKLLRRACAVLVASLCGFVAVSVCALTVMSFNGFVRESKYFVIQKIEVSGASASLDSQIRDVVADIKRNGNGNLAMLKPGHVRFNIETLPRVKAVQIAKVYPRTLDIKIEERQPLAATYANGLYWLDREGYLLGAADPAEIAAAGAPMVTGLKIENAEAGGQVDQPMLAKTLNAIAFLKDNDPTMSRRLAEWHLTDSDEVTAIMREGVEVRFGAQDPIKRMPALVMAMQVKPEWEKFTYFDLRFDSQVVYF